MLRLSEIMTKDVLTLTPEMTLRDAVELFSARHISGAQVVNGQAVVGVVSAADIIGFAACTPESQHQATEPDSGDFIPDEQQLERESVAPGSYFTNLFCEGSSDVVDRMSAAATPEWNLLDDHTVDEVMTRSPVTLSPNDPVIEAAELMRTKSIHRVLVVARGKIVGIVSALDIARAVAEHKLTARTTMFDKADRSARPRPHS